jgi:hypothetical protein
MTLATRGYTPNRNAWRFEAHFTATLAGSIHSVREQLRTLGISYFKDLIRERYGEEVPEDKIRGDFEPEDPALAPSPHITITPLEMTFQGKNKDAITLPTRTIPADIVAYDPHIRRRKPRRRKQRV